jgi:hypothetical protein
MDLLADGNPAKGPRNSVLAEDYTADARHLQKAETGERAQRLFPRPYSLHLIDGGDGTARARFGQVHLDMPDPQARPFVFGPGVTTGNYDVRTEAVHGQRSTHALCQIVQRRAGADQQRIGIGETGDVTGMSP